MPSPSDFPARGKVTSLRAGTAIFIPANTSYELHLTASGDLPLNTPIDVVIRVPARKVWSVPSGGNFVSPIFGPPKIIQGRVRLVTPTQLVIQAGTHFVVDLPADPAAVELPEGPIAANRLVNVTALPGATIELLTKSAVA
jgi:hypothetical protein